MCARFTLTSSGEALAAHFALAAPAGLEARFNIAPTQSVWAIRRDGASSDPAWAALRWGLIPGWAKDASIGHRLINARAETCAEKPAFRDALARRRCLVAADGFFEWSGPKDRRRAHWFRVRGGAPFAIAALWERWRDPAASEEGAEVETCTLLTTEANAVVRPHHDRMPVVLDSRDYGRWLSASSSTADRLALLVPCPPDWVSAEPVGPAVNDPRHDSPDCVLPPT